ncbi:MAG: rRNA pseudouridine synthase, partial [Melioribacteraceae bacterium]
MNKFLSECGIASRRKSEELILQGRVSVNGNIVLDLATQINIEKDIVQLDGEKIKSAGKVYFLLHKPKGFITSTSDEKDRRTVVELINTKEKIFPVGRLDFNTTGVLLLTNDGEFSNFITHPRNKIPREYIAT